MINLQTLAAEFAITVSNGAVWLAIAEGLIFGGICLVFGVWVARLVGLLASDVPVGETLGVGLASGLMVLAAWWAAFWSGGRSSFTPVAIGFAIAIAIAMARRARRASADVKAAAPDEVGGIDNAGGSRWSRHRSLTVAVLAGSAFVVGVALLFGSTMAPSPRDGAQPVEFMDEAFYAILGRDLATTGVETNLSPSGFDEVPGTPAQAWYHWGEMWLAAALITLIGIDPFAARYFIVLPIALLATAAMTGTLVRRLTRTTSRWAFLFGCFACVFLAPVPLIAGPFFGSWAVGMIFGITMFGLGAVAIVMGLYALAVLEGRPADWALAGFVGSAAAFILPAHVAIALLAIVGLVSVSVIRLGQSLIATHRWRVPSLGLRRTFLVAGILLLGGLAWGWLNGHSLSQGLGGGGTTPIVDPFNDSWRESVLITILGAGAFAAIAIAWVAVRKQKALQTDIYLGTMLILIAGAIGWGARVGEFTMFYLYFAGIAVFATPVAAVAIRALWDRLHTMRRRMLAAGIVVLCVVQLEFGVVAAVSRLQLFGAHAYAPIPTQLLEAMKQLPADAKFAYACHPLEEVGFATPAMLTIDAHTGRRVIPMCFEAEFMSGLLGGEVSDQIENLFFKPAPQRALYPNAAARPSSSAVAAFMKTHGIDYIYVDSRHANSLVFDAIPIVEIGDFAILRLP